MLLVPHSDCRCVYPSQHDWVPRERKENWAEMTDENDKTVERVDILTFTNCRRRQKQLLWLCRRNDGDVCLLSQRRSFIRFLRSSSFIFDDKMNQFYQLHGIEYFIDATFPVLRFSYFMDELRFSDSGRCDRWHEIYHFVTENRLNLRETYFSLLRVFRSLIDR